MITAPDTMTRLLYRRGHDRELRRGAKLHASTREPPLDSCRLIRGGSCGEHVATALLQFGSSGVRQADHLE
ncbi:unnamed protein product [Lampetra planeri]